MMKGEYMKCKTITFILLWLMSSYAAAQAGLTKTQVSQLYVSIFNRASESEGNLYWQSQSDMAAAATLMLATQAARDYFGANLNTNQASIEHIYYNTLNKTIAEDFEGISYWVGLLDAGTARGTAVASLINAIQLYAPDGAYYDPDDAVTVTAYNQFQNRVAVSDYMADTVEKPPADWDTSTQFGQTGLVVTDKQSSVNTAKSQINDMIPLPDCVDLDGLRYTVFETINLQNCGGGIDYDSFDVSISQNGCAASFQDSYGIWGTGTISGNHLTVHSSWYEAGGQVNAVYNATVSNDKQSLQGSGTGTWSDGQVTCHPLSSISGSLIHQ